MAWRRSGACNHCGDCCRSGNPFTGEPGTCPLAREQADGTALCSDRQHSYYLSGCNVWPSEPEHIADYPRCAYRFEWIDDGR